MAKASILSDLQKFLEEQRKEKPSMRLKEIRQNPKNPEAIDFVVAQPDMSTTVSTLSITEAAKWLEKQLKNRSETPFP